MNYVVSDIHGQYDLFLKLLDEIKLDKSDHLYILGDVLDRGPESIKILKLVMNSKNMTLYWFTLVFCLQ